MTTAQAALRDAAARTAALLRTVPDCTISADPVAFLLVRYGRTGQWGQIAHGKIMAGGRKPWLGFSFGRLITSP